MGSINDKKEFFELVGGTDSHSGSEIQQLVIPPRKKRYRRRLRNNPSIRHEEYGINCGCHARTISFAVLSVIIVCWLITLTWLAVVLYKEIVRLNEDVQKVVAAHQGVPDALQECHSLSRELQKNQTVIMDRLTGFSLMLANFSANMSEVRTSLAAVELQLKNSPSLLNEPRLVKDLSESVAKLGSKVQDLETTTSTLKEQDSRLDGSLAVVSGNLTDLQVQVAGLASLRDSGVSSSQLALEKATLLTAIGALSVNVSAINDTLSNKLQGIVNDHKIVEGLEEMNQNVSARLQTLEGLCTKTTTPSAIVPDSSLQPQQQQLQANKPLQQQEPIGPQQHQQEEATPNLFQSKSEPEKNQLPPEPSPRP